MPKEHKELKRYCNSKIATNEDKKKKLLCCSTSTITSIEWKKKTEDMKTVNFTLLNNILLHYYENL